ncbi:hypothetical protein FRC18_009137 [Serendipita sp. 400]|nr:hypothetical protein FRC18_009137 [Serendipita sp. 400]
MSGDNQKQGPLSRYSPNSAYLWRDCGVFVWSHMVYQVVEIIRRQPSRPLIVLAQERDSLVEQEGQGLRLILTPTPSEVPDSVAIPASQTPGHEYRTQSRTMLPSAVMGHEVDMLVSSGYLWENGQAIAEWKRDAYGRMIWAAVCAFILNIMTVGSAFSFDFVVPSIGLGYRSGGVLLYWMVSYIILITLVLATSISDHWSAHEARVRRYQTQGTVLFRHIIVSWGLSPSVYGCSARCWRVSTRCGSFFTASSNLLRFTTGAIV